MHNSQRRAIAEGLRRSAESRKCPCCQRSAAVSMYTSRAGRHVVCRWAFEGKCDDPAADGLDRRELWLAP